MAVFMQMKFMQMMISWSRPLEPAALDGVYWENRKKQVMTLLVSG